MLEEEKYLSPKQSLKVITETIIKTKDNFRNKSFYFLLWGWLLAVASFLSFFLQQFTDFQFYHLPFPVLTATGIVTTLVYHTKRKSFELTQTYLSYFLSILWLVLGVSFITVVMINVSQNLLPFTYTLLVAGIGTLVSGLVMKFKPLTLGGILFFIAALVCSFVSDNYKPFLHGIAIVAGYIIPGYMLKFSKI